MRKSSVTRALLLLLIAAIGLGGCAAEAPPAPPAETEAVQTNTLEVETMDFSHETENVIYLAGGCFWGLEREVGEPLHTEKVVVKVPDPVKISLGWNSQLPHTVQLKGVRDFHNLIDPLFCSATTPVLYQVAIQFAVGSGIHFLFHQACPLGQHSGFIVAAVQGKQIQRQQFGLPAKVLTLNQTHRHMYEFAFSDNHFHFLLRSISSRR